MGWQSKPSKQERYLAFCPLPDAKASKDLEELLDEDGVLPNRSKLAQLIEKAREKKGRQIIADVAPTSVKRLSTVLEAVTSILSANKDFVPTTVPAVDNVLGSVLAELIKPPCGATLVAPAESQK
jgi:hypothetical protein